MLSFYSISRGDFQAMSANHKSDYLIIGGSYEGAKRSNITNITYITIRLMFEEKIDLKVNKKKIENFAIHYLYTINKHLSLIA